MAERTWTQISATLWAHVGPRGKVYAKAVQTPGPCWAIYIGRTYYGEFVTIEDAQNFQTPGELRQGVRSNTDPDLPWS
jgi:hypothetical protein